MISRNITERLKRLEARAMPAGAAMVIEVQFVSVAKMMTALASDNDTDNAAENFLLWVPFMGTTESIWF